MKKLFCVFVGHQPAGEEGRGCLIPIPSPEGDYLQGCVDICKRCKVVYLRNPSSKEAGEYGKGKILNEELPKIQEEVNKQLKNELEEIRRRSKSPTIN
jgi:hypothetical protein